MTLEKPISTIKKAISGAAEEMASKELLKKPLNRHYQAVIDNFKIIREINPKLLEKLIAIHAKGKELKDELGVELDSIFKNVENEAMEKLIEKVTTGTEQIKKNTNIGYEELKEEKAKLIHLSLIEMGNQIKNDPRIINHFKTKKEILSKVLNYTTVTVTELFEIFDKIDIV